MSADQRCSNCDARLDLAAVTDAGDVQCTVCGTRSATSGSESSRQDAHGTRPAISPAALRRELLRWALGFLFLGVIHIIAADFLNPVWGVVLLVLGVLNLLIIQRAMFIVNGSALCFIGVLNIIAAGSAGVFVWVLIGGLQVVLGIVEIRKFGSRDVAAESGDAGASDA